MKRATSLVLSVVLIAVAGCREEGARAQVDKIMRQVEGLVEKGDADGAVSLLEQKMTAKVCEPFRPELILKVVQILTAGGRLDAAADRVCRAAGETPDLCGPALSFLMQHLYEQKEYDRATAWCGRLAKLKLPEQEMTRVAGFHLEMLRGGGRLEAIPETLSSYLGSLSPQSGRQVTERLASALLRDNQYEAVTGLLALIETNLASDPAWKALGAMIRMQLLLAKGQWQEAADHVLRSSAELPDEHVSPLVTRFTDQCQEAGQSELCDRICADVLNRLGDKPESRNAAARGWLNTALRKEDAALTVERLQALFKMEIPGALMGRLADSAYSLVMASASDAQLKVFADLCDGLLAQAPSDAEKASLRGMIMDSCFRLEDYERTLRLLDQGVPGQDEQWHKMMINKVKAHLALKEGRKQEAVDRFRAFMEYIRTQAMDQTDPVTGNRITKEEILGLNAKRIGDILASMGQDEDARAMYKSARESYQAALERTSPGPEYDRIQAELGKIPAP